MNKGNIVAASRPERGREMRSTSVPGQDFGYMRLLTQTMLERRKSSDSITEKDIFDSVQQSQLPTNEAGGMYHEVYKANQKFLVPDNTLQEMEKIVNSRIKPRKSVRFKDETLHNYPDKSDIFLDKLTQVLEKIDEIDTEIKPEAAHLSKSKDSPGKKSEVSPSAKKSEVSPPEKKSEVSPPPSKGDLQSDTKKPLPKTKSEKSLTSTPLADDLKPLEKDKEPLKSKSSSVFGKLRRKKSDKAVPSTSVVDDLPQKEGAEQPSTTQVLKKPKEIKQPIPIEDDLQPFKKDLKPTISPTYLPISPTESKDMEHPKLIEPLKGFPLPLIDFQPGKPGPVSLRQISNLTADELKGKKINLRIIGNYDDLANPKITIQKFYENSFPKNTDEVEETRIKKYNLKHPEMKANINISTKLFKTLPKGILDTFNDSSEVVDMFNIIHKIQNDKKSANESVLSISGKFMSDEEKKSILPVLSIKMAEMKTSQKGLQSKKTKAAKTFSNVRVKNVEND